MPSELKAEYSKVRFRCDQLKVPRHFFIITAHNPDGITVSASENREADQSFQKEITRLGFENFPVTGGSPDFTHSEPGYGILCSREEALSLARQFRQDALFEVIDGIVVLTSALDDPGPDEEIGSWSELCDTL